ncbi:hypothetical protein MMPV_002529 [Pyropia vietnamensis]
MVVSHPLLPLIRLYTSAGTASPPLAALVARLPAGSRGPIVGLDVGTRYVGVAVSDPSRRWAFPHSAYRRSTPPADASTLSALLASSAAVAVVAGYPIPTPGGVSLAADVDAYVTALVMSGLGGGGGERGGSGRLRAVALADERWSSMRAREALGVGVGTGRGGRGGGWRTWRGGVRRAKEAVDATAAAVILQDVLNVLPPDPDIN